MVTIFVTEPVLVFAGGLDLEGYLLRERRCIESDIELECAKIATLACVIELLERSKERIQKKLNDKASGP